MQRLYPALVALALLSCGHTPTVSKTVSVERNGANHKLKLEYPVVPDVPEAINKQIAEAALIHLEQVEDDPIPFEDFAKNVSGDPAVTQLNRESILTVAHKTAATLTTRCKTTDAVFYEVYDLKSGRRLELNDLFEPGKLETLNNPGPNEPTVGLLPNGIAFNDTEIPYEKLKGVLKPQYIP